MPESRTFTLHIRSREQGTEDQTRKVTLWADLGVMMDLADDPEHPLDLMTDTSQLHKLALDKFTQARVIYALSDAQDLDPREFARGLSAGGAIASALAAMQAAVADFFQEQGMPDHAQALLIVFDAMVQTRQEVAGEIRDAGVSERVIETLRSSDLRSTLNSALDDALKSALTESPDGAP